MRRQDIADFLGLKLETVSRTLAKLEQRKVIRIVPNGIFLTGLEQTLLVREEVISREIIRPGLASLLIYRIPNRQNRLFNANYSCLSIFGNLLWHQALS